MPTSNSLCESPLPISLWDTFVDVDCPLSLLKKKRREDFGLEAEFEELAWEGMRSILDIIAGGCRTGMRGRNYIVSIKYHLGSIMI